MSNPWEKPFIAKRDRPCSQASEVNDAIKTAQPGDDIHLKDGVYQGIFWPTLPGTVTSPIRLRGDNHAQIRGAVMLRKDSLHNPSFWRTENLDISDPSELSTIAGLVLEAPGVMDVNSVIHDVSPTASDNGIQSFGAGKGAIFYGTSVYNSRHNIYTQNVLATDGWKYLVHCMLFDPAYAVGAADPYTLHVYGGPRNTGYHFEQNIFGGRIEFSGGEGTTGGQVDSVFRGNQFYNGAVQIGRNPYNPTAIEFTDNYLARATLSMERFWGGGEDRGGKVNVVRRNAFILPPTSHIKFTTSLTVSHGGDLGLYPVNPIDEWDENQYSGEIGFYYGANGVKSGGKQIANWRNRTLAGGNRFDTNGQEIVVPTQPRIVMFQNSYDVSRMNLVVFNWGDHDTVTIQLPTFTFDVYSAKDQWGSVIHSNGDTAIIPVSGKEFGVYVIKNKKSLIIVPPLPDKADISTETVSVGNLITSIQKGAPGTSTVKNGKVKTILPPVIKSLKLKNTAGDLTTFSSRLSAVLNVANGRGSADTKVTKERAMLPPIHTDMKAYLVS